MKKRLLSAFLSLCMILAVFVGIPFNSSAYITYFHILGTQISSMLDYSCDAFSYNAETKTITFNSVNHVNSGFAYYYDDDSDDCTEAFIYISGDDDITININGESTIGQERYTKERGWQCDGFFRSYIGIRAPDCNITITGDPFNIYANYQGIIAKSLTVNNELNIHTYCESAIQVSDTLTVNKKLTATAENAFYYKYDAERIVNNAVTAKTINVPKNGTLIANSATNSTNSRSSDESKYETVYRASAIRSDTLNIKGGTVKANYVQNNSFIPPPDFTANIVQIVTLNISDNGSLTTDFFRFAPLYYDDGKTLTYDYDSYPSYYKIYGNLIYSLSSLTYGTDIVFEGPGTINALVNGWKYNGMPIENNVIIYPNPSTLYRSLLVKGNNYCVQYVDMKSSPNPEMKIYSDTAHPRLFITVAPNTSETNLYIRKDLDQPQYSYTEDFSSNVVNFSADEFSDIIPKSDKVTVHILNGDYNLELLDFVGTNTVPAFSLEGGNMTVIMGNDYSYAKTEVNLTKPITVGSSSTLNICENWDWQYNLQKSAGIIKNLNILGTGTVWLYQGNTVGTVADTIKLFARGGNHNLNYNGRVANEFNYTMTKTVYTVNPDQDISDFTAACVNLEYELTMQNQYGQTYTLDLDGFNITGNVPDENGNFYFWLPYWAKPTKLELSTITRPSDTLELFPAADGEKQPDGSYHFVEEKYKMENESAVRGVVKGNSFSERTITFEDSPDTTGDYSFHWYLIKKDGTKIDLGTGKGVTMDAVDYPTGEYTLRRERYWNSALTPTRKSVLSYYDIEFNVLEITKQPNDLPILAGKNAIFKIDFNFDTEKYTDYEVTWQRNSGGNTSFRDIEGSTGGKQYTLTGITEDNIDTFTDKDYQAKIVYSNSEGKSCTFYSKKFKLNNIADDDYSFRNLVEGNSCTLNGYNTDDLPEGCSLKWYYIDSRDESAEKHYLDCTDGNYIIDKVSGDDDWYDYYCEVICDGSVVGKHKFRLYVLGFETQPQSTVAEIGETVTFTANVKTRRTNFSNALYTWQVDKNDGNGFNTVHSGGNEKTYSFICENENFYNYKYRVLCEMFLIGATSPTLYSNEVKIINKPIITKQPTDLTFILRDAPGTVQFKVKADGADSYQWEIKDGSEFKDISGATSATLTLGTLTKADKGNVYRCKVSNKCGSVYSNEATLNLKTSPEFTKHPTDTTVGIGDEISIQLDINGVPTDGIDTYWEYSDNNGTSWHKVTKEVDGVDPGNVYFKNVLNISIIIGIHGPDGSYTPTTVTEESYNNTKFVTKKAEKNMNGWLVRCAFKDEYGIYYSNSAKINVLNYDVKMNNYTYHGTPSTPSMLNAPTGSTIKYYYSTSNSKTGGTEWKDITGTTLNAGEYYMYATVENISGYSGTVTTEPVKFTVNKATPLLTDVSASSLTNSTDLSSVIISYTVEDWAKGNLTVDEGQTLKYGNNLITYTFVPNDSTNLNPYHGSVNVTVNDTLPPTGKITLGTNNWTDFLNTITFGLFFNNTQTVKITASDNSNNDVTIKYLASERALTLNELKNATFKDYTDEFSLNMNKKYIVYAKLTDKAGNVTYISSNGIVIDDIAPIISGVENGKTYCGSVTVNINESYIDTVKVNGVLKTLDSNNQLVLSPAEGRQTIVVTDKAGNVSSEMIITVNSGHTYEWKSNDTQYWKRCSVCGDETTKKNIPLFTIDGSDKVCRKQNFEFGFDIPNGIASATFGYEFEAAGDGPLEFTVDNGKMKAVLPAENYIENENSFKITVIAKTDDGFDVKANKTVTILDEHIGGTANCITKAVCDICGKSYGEVDTNNHTGTKKWIKTETTHEQKCNSCTGTVIETEKHEWNDGVCTECGYICRHKGGEATCKEKAICEICGESYGNYDKHNHSKLRRIKPKDATEDEKGNIEYWHCEDCNKYYSDKDCKNRIKYSDTEIDKLSSSNNSDISPKTGESKNIFIWIFIFLISGSAIVATLTTKKKKK